MKHPLLCLLLGIGLAFTLDGCYSSKSLTMGLPQVLAPQVTTKGDWHFTASATANSFWAGKNVPKLSDQGPGFGGQVEAAYGLGRHLYLDGLVSVSGGKEYLGSREYQYRGTQLYVRPSIGYYIKTDKLLVSAGGGLSYLGFKDRIITTGGGQDVDESYAINFYGIHEQVALTFNPDAALRPYFIFQADQRVKPYTETTYDPLGQPVGQKKEYIGFFSFTPVIGLAFGRGKVGGFAQIQAGGLNLRDTYTPADGNLARGAYFISPTVGLSYSLGPSAPAGTPVTN